MFIAAALRRLGSSIGARRTRQSHDGDVAARMMPVAPDQPVSACQPLAASVGFPEVSEGAD
jgi:hypothetical protein